MSIKIYLCLAVLITFLSINNAAPVSLTSLSTTFGQSDQQQLIKFVNSQQQANGLFNGQLRDTFYAVGALSRLSLKPEKQESICQAVRSSITKDSDITSLYYAVSILSDLKCLSSGKLLQDGELNSLVSKSIESGSLDELAATVNVLFALADAKQIENDQSQLSQISKSILALEESDGTFRSRSTDDKRTGTLSNTATAHFVLARLAHRLKDPKIAADRPIKNILSMASESTRETLGFEDLQTTATLLRGLVSLSSANGGQGSTIEPSTIVRIAHYLLHFKNVNTLADAYYLLIGLKSVQKNNIGQPLAVELEQSVFPTAPVSTIVVSVRDVFGSSSIESTVSIANLALSSARQTSLLSNKEMTPTSRPGQYKFDVDKLKIGSYIIDVKVQPKDTNYNTVSASLLITVTGSISVDDFKISVADNKEALAGSKLTYEVAYGKKLTQVVSIPQNKTARFFFRVTSSSESFVAQQVGVRIFSPSVEVVLPASYSVDAYSVIITKEIGKSLKYQSGNYQVEIIIGDSSITPLTWNAGEISLNFSQPAQPLTRYPEHQPIEYTFRPEPVTPKSIIIQGFSLMVIAPTVIFVIGCLFIGVNFGKMPGGMGFIYTVAFLGCMVACGALIIKYWLSLTLDITLRYLVVLLIPTIFFGQKSLSAFAHDRLLSSKKNN